MAGLRQGAAIIFLLIFFNNDACNAQTLSLKDAVTNALNNYGTVKAKQNYAAASQALVKQSKRQYLPNVILSAQQDYGTINGQNGPLYGFGGYGVASSGPALNGQNWNAAFGALYLANVNWDFYSFGKVATQVKVAKAIAARDESDLAQEQFQLQIKVAAAYLNLIAAQRIVLSQQNNLDRAITFKGTSVRRVSSGLIPGVDSSEAAAEVSRAKIQLTQARDAEQERAEELAVLMGQPVTDFVIDTSFISKIPASILTASNSTTVSNPVLNYYQSRINWSSQAVKYYQHSYYPTLSMFGVVQGRGSGFDAAYLQDQSAFSQSYGNGVDPTRGNYLLGLGINWNVTSVLRNLPEVKAQKLITEAMKNEYDLASQQLDAQLILADEKIKNALENYNEAPIQVKAASDTYLQKSTMYKNGLATIVDVTQALYALNRAETDREIANANVWQALLLKAAASGQPALFMNEF